ncbi:MAG TPA: peptidoglycan-binding protein [Baekduia sp.]|uniref:C40 family peptidase n=1 Tax=Baekduia sp. TaxID=2600305 RepID=UPI002C4DBA84|nr:peptidoglycan-binding protein [Baekduia sp.]HMJ37524.1 peptidoglycan-binding protein [Baekduia sp.]
MDACAQTIMDGLLRGPDDRFAIFAEPPGIRDLGAIEPWEHSLARSRRRRQAAAARVIALPKAATARISAVLIAAGIIGQTAPLVGAAQAAQTTQAGGDLRSGSRGDAVAAAQRALGLAADGVFGPATRAAVRSFQKAHGLTVDGRIGPKTSAALGLSGSATASASTADLGASASAPAPSASVTRAVQRALGLSADGVFGAKTRAAVVAYQRSHALTVDGIVGPQTLQALGVSMSTSTGASTSSDSPTSTASKTSTSGSGVQAAVAAAMSKIGSPYVSGATGPSSFDCSGLTSWAMSQAGISIPRTSFAQYGIGAAVGKDSIQAGDLVFFNTAGPGASDVGLATGPTTAVSATTHGVMTHAIFDSYWGSHFVGARRVG